MILIGENMNNFDKVDKFIFYLFILMASFIILFNFQWFTNFIGSLTWEWLEFTRSVNLGGGY